MSRKNGICIDCEAEGITTKRPLATKPDGTPYPGPRCTTHKRARKKVVSARNHELRTEATYGITGRAVLGALRSIRLGWCAICQVSTGLYKTTCCGP